MHACMTWGSQIRWRSPDSCSNSETRIVLHQFHVHRDTRSDVGISVDMELVSRATYYVCILIVH